MATRRGPAAASRSGSSWTLRTVQSNSRLACSKGSKLLPRAQRERSRSQISSCSVQPSPGGDSSRNSSVSNALTTANSRNGAGSVWSMGSGFQPVGGFWWLAQRFSRSRAGLSISLPL